MTWFKVDDKLHDHRKARKAGKAAMGVWVLAGSWAGANETDGFVPADVLSRWGTPADARRLVEAGLWDEAEHDGEPGFRFHDWSTFQPSAAVASAKRAAEREGARLGNHKRWHVKRKVIDPACEYCARVPDQEPDWGGDELPDSPPNPPVPVPEPTTSSNEEVGHLDTSREDVELICKYLADAVEDNGSKRPTITKKWRDEARRLLDLDGRTTDQVMKAIDWCQRGESERALFWRPNVMSMPKLRAKFDQMRLQATQENRSATTSIRMQDNLAVVRSLAEKQHAQTLPEIGATQ